MPLYEYQCDACGHTFEKIQKFSDPHEDTCPKCGGKVQKLISSPAIQFKGSGFYITDYPKSSTDASGRKSSSDKAGSEKADSAKGDSTSSGDSSAAKTTNTTPSPSSSTKE